MTRTFSIHYSATATIHAPTLEDAAEQLPDGAEIIEHWEEEPEPIERDHTDAIRS